MCDAHVVFAAVEAESRWLRVSRQQTIACPHAHSTSHHPRSTNNSILRPSDRDPLVGKAHLGPSPIVHRH